MNEERNNKLKVQAEDEEMEIRPAPGPDELDSALPPEPSADVSPDDVAGQEEEAVTEETELGTLKREQTELNERYLRLHAEFDNYKKRMARDREELRKFANEGIIMELLSVIDHLEMAVKHAQEDVLQNVIQGVEMTLKEFERVLENNGVRRIEAQGRDFDPNVHHAMTQIPTTEAKANTVVEEFRKGYQLHEKVIRPALVAVATAPEESGSEVASQGDEEDVRSETD